MRRDIGIMGGEGFEFIRRSFKRQLCVSRKFLTERNRRRVLRMGAANFDNLLKFTRFVIQRIAQIL